MKNSEAQSRLSLYNYPAVILGVFILFLAIFFFFKEKFIAGIIVFFISDLMLTYKKVVITDTEEYSVTIYREIVSISNTSRTVFLQRGKGKIVLVSSINTAKGLMGNDNTFYNYDALYHISNNHKINIYTSTNEAQADKVAAFISNNLNIKLEHKAIGDSE